MSEREHSQSRQGRQKTDQGYSKRDRKPRHNDQRNQCRKSYALDNQSDLRGTSEREKTVPEHNPADLRRANRTDRQRSPEIDEDVTVRELDRAVTSELAVLDERNRGWVAKHLVMAGRLLDTDPQLAFEHSLAASRRGGRLAVVREAVGVAAYAAGEYGEALREFRTYRRISGDNRHIPAMVDSERALGRPEKALTTAAEVDLSKIPVTSQVELAIVVSGIHQELNDPAAAVAALEIPQLNPKRGFHYSPRLFAAYAQALEFAGQDTEAKKWYALADRAAEALGHNLEPEPEIFDLDLSQTETKRPRAKDVYQPRRK